MRLATKNCSSRAGFAYLVALSAITAAASTGCGAAGLKSASQEADEVEVGLTAEDLRSRAVLDTADFTTAVDESRYRATAPAMSEFPPTQKVIYLVGKLKRVPTDARIEVRWFRDADPTPMLVSEVRGSDTYEFIASFSPTEREFVPGSYTARLYVDDREVGARQFIISGGELLQGGPRLRRLAVSTKVNRKLQPLGAGTSFNSRTKRVCASFDLKNAQPGMVASVRWLRNGELFHEDDLDAPVDRRYAARIDSSSALPPGRYQVEVELDGTLAGRMSFTIGDAADGPRVDSISLGLELDHNNMPSKSLSAFESDTPTILCGLRFLDIPPGAAIEIHWIRVEEDGEMLLYTNRSLLASGGSGTMGADWSPNHEFEPGDYKVAVLINGEILAEEKFSVR